jgi:C1A family cysteine protease
MQSNEPMTDLAEQQMVSCVRDAYGCGGGFMESAAYVVKSGLTEEKNFPYRAANLSCKQVPITVKAASFTLLGGPNQKPTVEAIKTAILRYGSVFVTVAAGGSGWSGSRKEITGCRNRSTNHIVNLVGWTADNKWVMNNSWGTSWGDKGFALIPYDCDRIADEAGYIETN